MVKITVCSHGQQLQNTVLEYLDFFNPYFLFLRILVRSVSTVASVTAELSQCLV